MKVSVACAAHALWDSDAFVSWYKFESLGVKESGLEESLLSDPDDVGGWKWLARYHVLTLMRSKVD